jgi:hypothetical protein
MAFMVDGTVNVAGALHVKTGAVFIVKEGANVTVSGASGLLTMGDSTGTVQARLFRQAANWTVPSR